MTPEQLRIEQQTAEFRDKLASASKMVTVLNRFSKVTGALPLTDYARETMMSTAVKSVGSYVHEIATDITSIPN